MTGGLSEASLFISLDSMVQGRICDARPDIFAFPSIPVG